jgi:hypothetical protein
MKHQDFVFAKFLSTSIGWSIRVGEQYVGTSVCNEAAWVSEKDQAYVYMDLAQALNMLATLALDKGFKTLDVCLERVWIKDASSLTDTL